jgi:hypothetical protein
MVILENSSFLVWHQCGGAPLLLISGTCGVLMNQYKVYKMTKMTILTPPWVCQCAFSLSRVRRPAPPFREGQTYGQWIVGTLVHTGTRYPTYEESSLQLYRYQVVHVPYKYVAYQAGSASGRCQQ